MRYTTSKDGKKRCAVRMEIRFTAEEYQKIASLAKAIGGESVKNYLESNLLDKEVLHSIMEHDKEVLGI